MRGSSRLASRFSGFALLPLFSLASPLILLPTLARTADTATWASIAVGQSFGSVGLLVVTWGWTLSGPSIVARATPADRVAEIAVSLRARVSLLAVAGPAFSAAAVAVSPAGRGLDAAVMAAAMTAYGISPTWYAIGVGRASLILWYETIPRTAAIACSVAFLLLGAPAWSYPALLLAGTAAGQTVFYARYTDGWRSVRRIGTAAALRRNFAAALTEIFTGAYGSATVALASLGGPVVAIASLSGADRLFRLASFSISVTSNALQGHVASAVGDAFASRARGSIWAHLILGFGGGVTLAFLGPPVTGLLFAGQPEASFPTFLCYGLAFLAVAISTVVGRHVLVPTEGARPVLVSTACGAVLGAPAVLICGYSGLPAAVAGAFASSEVLVVVVQLVLLRRGGGLRTRGAELHKSVAAENAADGL